MNIQRATLFLIAALIPSITLSKEVVITFKISDARKKNIYEDIVKKTGLHKKKADNYHVTVAQIKDVDPKDEKALKSFLKSELKKVCKKGEIWPAEFVKAGRYLVNRSYENCPIVLYPSHKTAAVLREYNAALALKLSDFKAPSKKHYQFTDDVRPDIYTPHITLANSKYIKSVGANRDEVIEKIHRNLHSYGEAQKKAKKSELYCLALRT